jgi:DNA recombination-dependent growth factor C
MAGSTRSNGWLVVDAASPAKAEEFLEQLRKSIDGLPAKVLKVTNRRRRR